MAQLFHLQSYLPLVTPIGILSVALSTQLFSSDMEQFYFGANIWPFYPIPYEFLLPIITLFVARIRELPKKQRGEAV
jgi:spore germination protein KB